MLDPEPSRSSESPNNVIKEGSVGAANHDAAGHLSRRGAKEAVGRDAQSIVYKQWGCKVRTGRDRRSKSPLESEGMVGCGSRRGKHRGLSWAGRG